MPTLAKVPRGISVFVDANILVYFFTQMPPLTERCKALFERASRLEIDIFTSAHVAIDVIHRVMLAEAIVMHGLAPRDAVSYLKSHPNTVKQLQWYRTIPSDIARARVHILDVTYRELHLSKKYRDHHGLLTGDSIILAVMERHKLVHLVTNDSDFKRIPGIKVWMPR